MIHRTTNIFNRPDPVADHLTLLERLAAMLGDWPAGCRPTTRQQDRRDLALQAIAAAILDSIDPDHLAELLAELAVAQ